MSSILKYIMRLRKWVYELMYELMYDIIPNIQNASCPLGTLRSNEIIYE